MIATWIASRNYNIMPKPHHRNSNIKRLPIDHANAKLKEKGAKIVKKYP